MKRMLLTAIILTGCTPAISRADFNTLTIFGDSLSDQGNSYTAGGGVSPGTNAAYPGRSSNGANWVDLISPRLGVSNPLASLEGGTNYAYAGALTSASNGGMGGLMGGGPGAGTGGLMGGGLGGGTGGLMGGGPGGGTGVGNLAQPVDVDVQVQQFVAAGGHFAANDLVTVWAGGNDVMSNYSTVGYDPIASVNSLVSDVKELAAVGGKFFVVPNLLGYNASQGLLSASQFAAISTVSTEFNLELQSAMTTLARQLGVTIVVPDIYDAMAYARLHPSEYGLTNVTDSLQTAEQDGLNPDPSTYLYWDTAHPTQVGYGIIADTIDQAIISAVPEPSSAILTIVGLSGMSLITIRNGRREARMV